MREQLEIEIGGLEHVVEKLDIERLRNLCVLAVGAAGLSHGHLAVEFVLPQRIQILNREYRGIDKPTDVLSFPVDETSPAAGPRELGDVIICPELCGDLAETVLHGVLHLVGLDHETDNGQMISLQKEIFSW